MTPRINWMPSNQELRKFGWTLLIGFGVIGLLVFFKGHRATAGWMWGISAFILLLSLTIPVAAKPFYMVWMGLGMVIGSIMSRVVLTIIFFLVLTPVALFFRLTCRDALRIKKTAKDAPTYWNDHPKISDPKYYDHLF